MDGGSRDGTLEVAKAQGLKTYGQRHKGIRFGYIVITFSPDGNCPAEPIPLLRESMTDGYDMAIASVPREARSEDDDLLTGFGNWMFTRLINIVHGGRYTDAMGILRTYRTALFRELALDKEESYAPEKLLATTIGIEPLLSIRCAKRRLRVSEIPVPEPPRIGGKRKLQMFRWGGAYLLQIVREIYHWR